MHRRVHIALAIVLAMLVVLVAMPLTGCDMIIRKGVEEATGVKVDEDDGSVSIETKEGTLGTTEGKLPEGFPADFPIYQPSKIITGISMESDKGQAYMVSLGTDDAAADVGSWYKEELSKNGWTIKNAVEHEAGNVYEATNAMYTANVVVAAGGDDMKTGVQISLAPPKAE